MKIRKEDTSNIYLYDTNIENLFIGEYMTTAPGDYVKVYLFALMYANLDKEVSVDEMSKALKLKRQSIVDAMTYWQQLGLIVQNGDIENGTVTFISPKEKLYGKKSEDSFNDQGKSQSFTKRSTILQDKVLEELYSAVSRIVNRPLGGKEPIEIVSWIQDFGATPEMIMYAYSYSVHEMKKDSVAYVASIVKRWKELNLTTTDKIEEYLKENDRRKYLQKRIFQALGFTRRPTEKEREMMENWIDNEGFTLDVILEACDKTSGISNPNLNYVDKVLKSRKQQNIEKEAELDREASHGEVIKYYEYIRENAIMQAKEREEEIYRKLPEIKEINQKMRNCGIELSREMLAMNTQKVGQLREKYSGFMIRIADLLTANGYPADYLEDKYQCEDCKDTGLTDTGERCHCYLQRCREAKEWRNSLKK